jgi:hypothetical protein
MGPVVSEGRATRQGEAMKRFKASLALPFHDAALRSLGRDGRIRRQTCGGGLGEPWSHHRE